MRKVSYRGEAAGWHRAHDNLPYHTHASPNNEFSTFKSLKYWKRMILYSEIYLKMIAQMV